jgi:hypothetical protein
VHADDSQGWHLGKRVDRLRASRSYGFVLGLVLIEIVFLAAGPDTRGAWSIFVLFQTLILIIASSASSSAWASGIRGRSTLRP